MVIFVTCKNKEDPIESVDNIFPSLPYGSYLLSVALETRVLFRSAKHLMQPFPHPMMFQIKLAHMSQRESYSKVFMHKQRRTDGRRLESYPMSSPYEPSAQVSYNDGQHFC